MAWALCCILMAVLLVAAGIRLWLLVLTEPMTPAQQLRPGMTDDWDLAEARKRGDLL